MTTPLLDVHELSKTYGTPPRWPFVSDSRRTAVDTVSFSLEAGQTLALVGESGAGKSTVARLVLRLMEPDGGTIAFDGTDVLSASKREIRRLRRSMQMVFQDPYTSLDPRMTIGASVAEPLLVHDGLRREERLGRAVELLERVGLTREHALQRPYGLSGGQLQRASIARALALRPKLLVCDEPVAALDVSVQAQVMNLLLELQRDFGLAYLFITHDLALVPYVADDVAVMRHGALVEIGPTEKVLREPQHPYTQSLVAAVPLL